MQQFAGKNGLFGGFVRIKRRNTLFRGAEFLVRKTRFFQRIEIAVPGQNQGSSLGNEEIGRMERNTFFLYFLHLLPEILAIHSNPVAENVDDFGTKNTGRQQMQRKRTTFIHHRMTGVSAALIANYNIILFRKKVYHTTLAFVSPVDTDNGAVCHITSSIHLTRVLFPFRMVVSK